MNREIFKKNILDRVCDICGENMVLGGPIYTGNYAERKFCESMLRKMEEWTYWDNRLMKLVRTVKSEIDYPPTFYDIDRLCSSLGLPSIPTDTIINKIEKKGYRVINTHFDPRGIKTDAPIWELRDLT